MGKRHSRHFHIWLANVIIDFPSSPPNRQEKACWGERLSFLYMLHNSMTKIVTFKFANIHGLQSKP